MGTITALSIIVKAQKVLQDATGVRWDNTELLGWLNSAQREIVLYKPNSNSKGQAVKLVAGTRQALPTDGVQLIDVVRNMGTSGNTPGRAVRQIERETLDAVNHDWHASSASTTAKHYVYNPLEPKAFYVYPPQPVASQGYVEIVYGALPPDATINGTISVDDIYETPLIDGTLYRAFSKDSEYADVNKASVHHQAFITALTGKARVEVGTNPASAAPANTVPQAR